MEHPGIHRVKEGTDNSGISGDVAYGLHQRALNSKMTQSLDAKKLA